MRNFIGQREEITPGTPVPRPRSPGEAPVIQPGSRPFSWDRLMYVDDRTILAVLGRLLSSKDRIALLNHTALEHVKGDINRSRLPADLNCALVAMCLMDAAPWFFADLAGLASPDIEQPVRVEGVVVTATPAERRRKDTAPAAHPASNDLLLKVKLAKDEAANVRLAGARSYGWTTGDLAGRRILAIGLLRRPQARQVAGAAVVQLEPVPGK
ncbi:MAG TPA: hypothetical protein VF062_05560 [Candidatus Limnocylindrales bacterium]